MTDRADVVVVGGGVIGLSAALHLLMAGVPNVRVLERDGLFEGTSRAGAGFLAPWSALTPAEGSGSPNVPVERYSMDFYAELQAAGHDVGYRRTGLLWLAASEPAWLGLQSMAWEAADSASVAVPPDRLPELTGGAVSSAGIAGARWLPNAARVEARKVGAALTDRIVGHGGVIDTRRPVTEIRSRAGRVTGVETSRGRVDSPTVVIAAGAWSNSLLRPVGGYLPAVPQVTSRITTGPLDLSPTLPMLMLQGLLPDEPGGGPLLWAREHDAGLVWGGMYGTNPRNLLVGRTPPDRLDELPLDGILENQRVARAATFLPALTQPASIRVKHGAVCYTPDDLALVGPVPELAGLYAVGGDNERGFTAGPGFGRLLAEQIAAGSGQSDSLRPWSIDRFAGRYVDDASTFAGMTAYLTQLLGEAPTTGPKTGE